MFHCMHHKLGKSCPEATGEKCELQANGTPRSLGITVQAGDAAAPGPIWQDTMPPVTAAAPAVPYAALKDMGNELSAEALPPVSTVHSVSHFMMNKGVELSSCAFSGCPSGVSSSDSITGQSSHGSLVESLSIQSVKSSGTKSGKAPKHISAAYVMRKLDRIAAGYREQIVFQPPVTSSPDPTPVALSPATEQTMVANHMAPTGPLGGAPSGPP